MELDLVISIIEENGYIGLFLWLWFGIFLMPVPNEVILMTVGLAASMGSLNPFIAFLVSYAGIVSMLTTSHILGRLVGRRLLRLLEKRKRFANTIDSSMKLMEKHHAFSLSLSCFIPGARNLVPLLYGLSKLSFKTFAMFAYTGAFVWVTIVFVLGYLFGDKMDTVVKFNEELWLVAIFAAAGGTGLMILRRRKMKHTREEQVLGADGAVIHERQQK